MIINDLDGYYIVFDTKNWNTELDTLIIKINSISLGTTLFSRYNFPLHHLISLIKLLSGSLPSVMRP